MMCVFETVSRKWPCPALWKPRAGKAIQLSQVLVMPRGWFRSKHETRNPLQKTLISYARELADEIAIAAKLRCE